MTAARTIHPRPMARSRQRIPALGVLQSRRSERNTHRALVAVTCRMPIRLLTVASAVQTVASMRGDTTAAGSRIAGSGSRPGSGRTSAKVRCWTNTPVNASFRPSEEHTSRRGPQCGQRAPSRQSRRVSQTETRCDNGWNLISRLWANWPKIHRVVTDSHDQFWLVAVKPPSGFCGRIGFVHSRTADSPRLAVDVLHTNACPRRLFVRQPLLITHASVPLGIPCANSLRGNCALPAHSTLARESLEFDTDPWTC